MDLKEKFEKQIVPEMAKKYGYTSPLAVPRVTKIVVNVGIGRVSDDKDRELIEKHLSLIVGQKPSGRPAKKAIASFKTRKGMVLGLAATLRGRRMYDFLSRFINIALPRTRDFRGIPVSNIDERGNLTIGIREHIVFPEIIGEDVKNIFGLEATLVTNMKDKEKALEMFKLMGLPFQS
jgi:large subunit ribosomal protein L5